MKNRRAQHQRASQAILSIEDKVADIRNLLRDLNMKLCHLIRDKGTYKRAIKENQH